MARGHFEFRYLMFAAGALCLLAGNLRAQQAQSAPAGPTPPPTPRAAAPEDFTGYWVAVITEDWRFRMVTPPKGDFASVPLNPEGIKAANEWDQAKDIAAGEQCRAFGAGGIMRMPVRLHIAWQDDQTLKMEIDNGNQVRLFHFDKNAPAPAQPDWQGFSVAAWETLAQGQSMMTIGNAARRGIPGPNTLTGSLKSVTTKMRPGYLRRNGIPYSGDAVLTEFLDRTTGPNNETWLILTSSLDDPKYLTVPFFVTTHYKKEPDGSKFSPRPCEATMPVGVTVPLE
jgi:hypothetical protein